MASARDEAMRRAVRAGIPRKQVAQIFRVSLATVYSVTPKCAGWPMHGPDDPKRAAEIERCYREGQTLEQIGISFGVSRERVRQILRKHLRVMPEEGGIALRSRRRKEAERERLNSNVLQRWGISRDEYQELVRKYGPSRSGGKRSNDGRNPFRAFERLRQNARANRVEWRLSFPEYWALWKDHWDQKKRGAQGMWLVRRDAAGPYSVENCHIVNGREASSAARIAWWQRRKKGESDVSGST